MYSNYKKPVIAALAATIIWAAAVPAARAQETARGTAVVYPIRIRRNSGDPTSRQTGVTAVHEALEKAGFTLISDTVAANTWQRLGLPRPERFSPARTGDLVRFGKEVNANYVVAPTFYFHSRSIWVDLGPRTVSTAHVSVVIVDARTGNVVYSRKDIQGRSDEKFNVLEAGLDVLVTPLATVVSGGPKTPHEQRAVQIAVAKALREWGKNGG